MDEQLKQRVMVAVLAFNTTVIIYMIGMGFYGPAANFMSRLGVGMAIGAVVGAVAFVGVMLSQK